MALRRFCVFCGNTPEDKNKEDIIPTWLQEFTGDPKRQARWKSPLGTYEFSFSSFKFPACKSCNQGFSAHEYKVQKIFERLEFALVLTQEDLDVLLDWFDKIRVGLWLGMKYLDKSTESFERHFHIKDRIGQKDRSLHIYKTNENKKRLNFFGPGTIPFDLIPSCFVLIVNDLVFINSSFDFLYAKQLGFPYPIKVKHHLESGKLFGEYILTEGSGKIKKLINPIPTTKPLLSIYQSIFPGYATYAESAKTMFLDSSKSKSIIFANCDNKTKPIHGAFLVKFYSKFDSKYACKTYEDSLLTWVNIYNRILDIQKKGNSNFPEIANIYKRIKQSLAFYRNTKFDFY